MNPSDIIILIIVFVFLAAAAIWYFIRKRKGRHSCGGCCSSCPFASDNCKERKIEKTSKNNRNKK